MLDFSSAHYLGFNHELGSLPHTLSLTTGKPAALLRSALQRDVEKKVARFLRAGHATVRRSTLHAFVDIYSRVRADRHVILVDAGAYPVQKWAINMARGRGTAVRQFRHHDTSALARELAGVRRHGLSPVVAADGYCTGCGWLTPMADYLDIIRPYGGQLLIDDTQCTGILGDRPGAGRPWGRDGAGSHVYAGTSGDPNLTLVTSFAKGMAAPVAAIAGKVTNLDVSGSATNVHSSPPTNADLAALDQALIANEMFGNRLRKRLLDNIICWRRELKKLGVTAAGSLFPVQSINVPSECALSVQHSLHVSGIRAVITESCCGRNVAVNLIITARHSPRDVISAARAVHAAVKRPTTSRRAGPRRGRVAHTGYRKRTGSIV